MSEVQQYMTSDGRRIYTFPVQAFPVLIANIYLISDGDKLLLVDCGSGLEQSNQDLLDGLAAIEAAFGESASLADIDAILITHGHMDHFGGLSFVRQHSQAPIGVHPLDRRVLSNYEERVIVASRNLESFLRRAGVAADKVGNLMSMYLYAKGVYRSTPVDFMLEEEGDALEDITIYHVPGHCPGQVCLQVDDILLTADHILAKITPHQAPETITNHMGLAHYFDSLDKIAALDGIRLGLGGHEEPMPDLSGRIGAIKQAHEERLNKILDICDQSFTIAEISKRLFGSVDSYHVLLALEEAGAHVEHLYQLGELAVANIDEIEEVPDPVFRYRRC